MSALAITNYTGKYLLDTLGQSPFSLAQPVRAPFLNLEEHLDLYAQYEAQEQSRMDPKVKQQIFAETGGAQGLEQMCGKFYHIKFKSAAHDGNPISITQWLNYVYSGELLNFCAGYPNLQDMFNFLSSANSVRCRTFLATVAASAQPQTDDVYAKAELVRKNILLQTPTQELIFASPLVRRFVLSCLVQSPPPLTDLPLLEVDEGAIVIFPKLVIEIVKAMNPLEIASARRKKQNPASKTRDSKARHPPGPKEATYVRHFTSTMMHILVNFKSSVKYDLPIFVFWSNIFA